MKKWLCMLLALLIPLNALAESGPMLIAIGMAEGTAKANQRTIKAAGVGKRAPWGVHHADVVYESLLYQQGQTRLLALFQSELPTAVGPVRSARESHFLTREEWQGTLLFCGDAGSMARDHLAAQGVDPYHPQILNHHQSAMLRDHARREKGVKAPDNLTVDLASLSTQLPQNQPSQSPIRFGSVSTNGESCSRITLDWGHASYLTSLRWENGEYRFYRASAPLLSYSDAQKSGEGTQLAFASVIVQHVSYAFPSAVVPLIQAVGSGEADYFINGQHFKGSWVRESPGAPTAYLDAEGVEMTFPHGKIYIALFPDTQALVYEP